MRHDPKTKEQFVDRLLSYEFDGDFTDIGATRASLKRVTAHKFQIMFPATGQRYEIVVRKPRAKTSVKAARRPTARRADKTPTPVAKRHIDRAQPVRRAK